MRIDHVGLDASDYERSKAFYERALAPLGLKLLMEPVPEVGGFGSDLPFFWIGKRGRGPQTGVHVAFAAKDREMVDTFHAAALAAGGTDNGGPGVREIYHPNYYGAFVLDPDGNNVEAVCHQPTELSSLAMVSQGRVRPLALAQPEAVEEDHHGRPSFRVGGRIFATLWDESHMNVMLDEPGIRTVVQGNPHVCAEVWWGKRLRAVQVKLDRADEALVAELLADAWEQKAPKRLLKGWTGAPGSFGP